MSLIKPFGVIGHNLAVLLLVELAIKNTQENAIMERLGKLDVLARPLGSRHALIGRAVSGVFANRSQFNFICDKLNGRYGQHGVNVAKVAAMAHSYGHEHVLQADNAKEKIKIRKNVVLAIVVSFSNLSFN